MFPAFVMAAVCCTPLAARSLGDHFEGEWIRDRAQSVSPPNVGEVNPLVAETMLVTRDDGVRFKGRIDEVYADGQRLAWDSDFPEDGTVQEVGDGANRFTVRETRRPDGGRHVISYPRGSVDDGKCHGSIDGGTPTGEGTQTEPDGSTGDYTCVFHRNPQVIPVAAILLRWLFG